MTTTTSSETMSISEFFEWAAMALFWYALASHIDDIPTEEIALIIWQNNTYGIPVTIEIDLQHHTEN